MIRIKYHPPGTPPATLRSPDSSQAPASSTLSLIQYDADRVFEQHFNSFSKLAEHYNSEKVNWIHIQGLGDLTLLQEVAAYFKIHPLAMEDVLNTTQRPKVEHYPEHYFVVSEMVFPQKKHHIVIEQLSLFLGKSFLITIQGTSDYDIFESLRERIRAGQGYARTMQTDYLAYALLDTTLDRFFPVLEATGEKIDHVEDELLNRPTKATLKRLFQNKHTLLQLRRAAWPQREIFNTLLRDDTGLISAETKIFLRDCYDHSIQIIDLLESLRDITAGLVDVYLSSLGVRTNEIMRILTIISSIFIPPTFIAGIYGMNFNTEHPFNLPELNWPYGYFFCLGLMLACMIGMLIFFKRKKWL